MVATIEGVSQLLAETISKAISGDESLKHPHFQTQGSKDQNSHQPSLKLFMLRSY